MSTSPRIPKPWLQVTLLVIALLVVASELALFFLLPKIHGNSADILFAVILFSPVLALVALVVSVIGIARTFRVGLTRGITKSELMAAVRFLMTAFRNT